jgi:rod shape-determining protein MreC
MRLPGDQKQIRRFGTEPLVFAALVTLSFSTLLLSTSSFVFDFKDIGFSLFSGLRGGIYEGAALVSRTILSIQELATLRREYSELTNRIARYEQLERNAAEIQEENRRLREQLQFAESLRFKHIPAELIGRDPDNLFSAFVINKGSMAGVEKDMPVIAYQNGAEGLVGKVIQVSPFESQIMPLYDVNCHVASRFQFSRYEGIVEGQGRVESPLLMRFIRKRSREEINQGDIVISSGIERGIYPAGIIIGRVSNIIDRDYEISLSVEIESAVDFSRLEYVFVIDTKAPASRDTDG